MDQIHKPLIVVLAAGLLASACSASMSDPAPSNTGRQQSAKRMGNSVTDTSLPASRRFRTLDEYLEYLEKYQGPIDGPWYKQVSPGVYELQTGNLQLDDPSKQKRIFTRQELEKEFGFTK